MPLSIYVDGVEYRDGLTVSPREFRGMERTAKRHPMTSQPPAAEEIAAGKGHEEVAAAVESFLPRAENLVSVKSLSHMV